MVFSLPSYTASDFSMLNIYQMNGAYDMKIFSFKRISFVLALCLIMLPVIFTSRVAFGTERFYITQDGSGSKDGTSWENAAYDLKSLIDNTNKEAEIWVARGTYSPGAGSEDTFSLKKGLKIYGGFAGAESSLEERDAKKNVTILSGNNISRSVAVVTSRNGALSSDTCLYGFTVTGGENKASGGGLYTEIDSNPVIAECIFSDNIAYLGGGGVYNYFSSPVILNCAFIENMSVYEHGGGVSNYYSSPVFTNCTFEKNEATYGGGMFSFESNVMVENSSFIDNKSLSRGAGMSSLNSQVAVTNSEFSGNHAQEYGGGMYCEDSKQVVIINNCVFKNNRTSPGNGGGMANIGSSVEIIGCKFTMNEADFFGGSMINTKSSLLISDCVFSENKALRFNGGAIANWGSSLTINDSKFSENSAGEGEEIFNYNSSSTIEKSVFSEDEKGNTTEGDKK